MTVELAPRLRFLSLFVPDLATAARRYREVLGVAPVEETGPALAPAPSPHPFAAAGPGVFDLGGVALALYQCDQRTTHPGDVGIGLEADPRAVADRAARRGGGDGKVFFGPKALPGDDGRELAAFVMPDRHFFEVLGPRR